MYLYCVVQVWAFHAKLCFSDIPSCSRAVAGCRGPLAQTFSEYLSTFETCFQAFHVAGWANCKCKM